MKNRAAIIIFLSILLSGGHCIAAIAVTQTSSPSFYCHKKVSPIEALICSDNKLSKLDSQLAKKFSETKATNKADANYLITDQRKWLKKRIQQCSYNGKDEAPADDKRQDYISCLQRLYEQRILAAVDPDPLSHKNDKKKHSSELAEEDIGYKPDLKHWSQQGNWEKRQYDALQPILNNAKNALQSYYHTKFEVNKDQASEGAG